MRPLKDLLTDLNGAVGSLSSQKTTKFRRRLDGSSDEDKILGVEGLHPALVDCELKIVQCEAHRRLYGKTQVITDPKNPHIRTRSTHTGEVVSISSIVAAILGVDIDLTKAIALGHDIGHLPLGKPGEKALRELTRRSIEHATFGVVIAQHIERGGEGLNLTHETLKGIWEHSRGKERLEITNGMSPESALVMISDKIAYITGDLKDAYAVGLPLPEKLVFLVNKLGSTSKERINRLIASLCLESAEQGKISFVKSETAVLFQEIKQIMYDEVYPRMDLHDSRGIVERIYEFLGRVIGGRIDPVVAFCLLTDQEVIRLASQHILDVTSLAQTGMWEILPTIQDKKIEWWEPDLDW